jgi:hypothetical protein
MLGSDMRRVCHAGRAATRPGFGVVAPGHKSSFALPPEVLHVRTAVPRSPATRAAAHRHVRFRLAGGFPGCLVTSILLSLTLTVLLNVLIRVF